MTGPESILSPLYQAESIIKEQDALIDKLQSELNRVNLAWKSDEQKVRFQEVKIGILNERAKSDKNEIERLLRENSELRRRVAA